MWNYSKEVMEHFFHPKNMGEIKNADAIGHHGSITCGDVLKLFLKIKNNVITDVKFKTFGCGSAIASSSVLTEMIKGKTIEEALKIESKDIVEKLKCLPMAKMHCSVMGREALHDAIDKYKQKKESKKSTTKKGKLICRCFDIYENPLRETIKKNKLKNLKDVINYTKAGGSCGACHKNIKKIIDDIWQKK